MAGSDASGRSREEEDLARLKFAASTAEEAARWLRNSLARIRSGHEVEVEIQNAEKALAAALAVLVDLHVLRAPHLSAGEMSGGSSYGADDGG